MPLIDFDSRFPDRDLVAHAYQCASSSGDRTLPAPGLVLDIVAVARVDHGRWIADCPCEGCAGAEFVSLASPVFFCTECRNGAWANVPIRVALPDEKTRGQVDAYLCARPAPANRLWNPGETVAELRRENREHGIRLSKEEG